MKNLTLFLLLFIHVSSHGMLLTPKSQNDSVLKALADGKGAHSSQVDDTYDHYYCNLETTATVDDRANDMFASYPLFVQLCVQASKATGVNPGPFDCLIQKIKAQMQEGPLQPQELVAGTHRDFLHRLLSYIPEGHVHALVNDKKIILGRAGLYSQTVQDANDAKKIKAGLTTEILVSDYNFESDKEHHVAIVDQFKKLVNG